MVCLKHGSAGTMRARTEGKLLLWETAQSLVCSDLLYVAFCMVV